MQFRLSTLFLLFVVLWSSLAVFGECWGIGVFVAVVVLAIYIQNADGFRVELPSMWTILVILLCLGVLIGLLMPGVQSPREASRRSQCQNNLHSIVLALVSYEAKYHRFPPAYVADRNGRPMHSWRVLILPFLELDDHYKQYNFNEPWDGPNNRKLLAARPRVFACPADKDTNAPGSCQTNYVAVVGSDAAWLGDKSRHMRDFLRKGTTDTIMLVETANAGIAWTEPRDLSVDALQSAGPGSSVVTASSRHGDYNGFFYSRRGYGGINAAFADGHGQYISPGALSPKVLPDLLKIGGATDEALDKAEATIYSAPSWDDKPYPNWTNILALLVWLASVGLLLFRAVRSRKANRGAANSSA
jgi:prepilin-type processing-associated H-X9-DG protein